MKSLTAMALALLASLALAAPVSEATSDPATVYFTPYKFVGCRQSQNPKDPAKPVSYNVTTGSKCVTPPYAFASYVESANALAANGPCAFSIYSGAGCTGTVTTGQRTTFAQCVTDSSAAGQSVLLACGP